MMSGFLRVMREPPLYLTIVSQILATVLIRRFNRGGKLPGLRGGPDARGCSGGSASDGERCFSTRLMWRTGGAGEGKLIELSGNVEADAQCTRTFLPITIYVINRMSCVIPMLTEPRSHEDHSRTKLDNGKLSG